MNEIVRIKSFSKGLTIRLDENASFDEILSQLGKKFREGKAFFGNSSVAIAFEGRNLNEVEELQLVDVIQYNCNLKVLCLVCKDEAQEKLFAKAALNTQVIEQNDTSELQIQVFRGSLSDGEKLETPNSIILLGDVGCGCSITSERNIMILGTLYGTARAGYLDGTGRIAALEMAPEELSIGDFTYTMPKKNKWARKKKDGACATMAVLRDGTIEIEDFTKECLIDF